MPRATESPRPATEIDWGAFQVAMLTNQAYQRVSAVTSAQRSVSRLETYFSTHAENWTLAAVLWREMVTECPSLHQPTEEEIAVWNGLAQATNMPIKFDSSGYLVPTDEAEDDG